VTRHSTKIRSLTLDQPQEVTVKRLSARFAVFATLVVLLASAVKAQTPGQKKDAPSKPETAGLGGTSWQLVKCQSMDDKTLIPDDKAKYTLEFGTDGGISARIDCNRGRSTWKSSGPVSSSSVRWSSLARCARPARCTITSSRTGVTSARTCSKRATSSCR
jgi:hypothetical protein